MPISLVCCLCLFSLITVQAQDKILDSSPAIGTIIYYDVPFTCSVKPGLGCGSAVKPVIIKLLADPNVIKTKFNREGSVLAVEWIKDSNGLTQKVSLENAFVDWQFIPDTIKISSEIVQSTKWYINLEVDSLSLEEATENADILITIIKRHYIFDSKKEAFLFKEIEDYYRTELVILRNEGPLDRWEKELNQIFLK